MSNIINFDFKPHLNGYETEEPSIRGIVYKYYAEHFTLEEAERFTAQYLESYEDSAINGNKP